MNSSLKLAGVIGYPVEHSLSPRLHNCWLKQLGIPGTYLPLPARPEQFSKLISALHSAGFAGVNITVPHKQAAFALSETVDEAARLTGAVNLLTFKNGRLEGFNTDVEGLHASLAEEFGEASFKGQKVVVLGAGGAARAAIVALDRMGVAEIRIVNRGRSRMAALIGELRSHTNARLTTYEWPQWPTAAEAAALVMNATSGGMTGAPALALSLDRLSKDAAVYDLVYNPLETALLRQARERGHRCANGLGMLMHQAVPSFEAFFGVRPAVTLELRVELQRALSS